MKRNLAAHTILSSVLLLCSCRTELAPFDQALKRAEEARRRGDFSAERRQFEEAISLSQSERERSEAMYRSAHSWLREGNFETGATELEALAKQHPGSPRASRAWLDAGRAREKMNQLDLAKSCYKRVIDDYPESGSANAAVTRWLDLSSKDPSARDRLLSQLIEAHSSPPLDSFLRFLRARGKEEISARDAILAYEDVAKRHPLPKGLYTDEALLRAAELRQSQGDFEGALTTLKLLDRHSEGAALVGTYVRGSYIKALFLQALILQKDLRRLNEAKDTYRLFIKKHPDSRFVDDALLHLAQIAVSQGRDGCSEMEELRLARPDSRYEKCSALLCPSAPPLSKEREASCRKLVSE